MRSPCIFAAVASSLALAGCHIPAPALIAGASCAAAEAGAAVAAAVATDANAGANATKAAARTQQTANHTDSILLKSVLFSMKVSFFAPVSTAAALNSA